MVQFASVPASERKVLRTGVLTGRCFCTEEEREVLLGSHTGRVATLWASLGTPLPVLYLASHLQQVQDSWTVGGVFMAEREGQLFESDHLVNLCVLFLITKFVL